MKSILKAIATFLLIGGKECEDGVINLYCKSNN